MKYYETPEFLALNEKWRKKLASKKFVDIEQPDGLLKIWASHFFKLRDNGTNREAKEEYFRLAGHFLYDHAFKNEEEKLIWELHSTGATLDEVVTEFKRRKLKMYREKVYRIVKELAAIMVKQCKSKT